MEITCFIYMFIFTRAIEGLHVSLSPSTTSYTVTEGDNIAAIICSATCYPACTYTWSRSGSRVSSTATLYLGQIERREAGSYICTARNPESSVSKNGPVVNVNVIYGPDNVYLTSNQTFYTVTEGHTLEAITCSAICYPACTYTWSKSQRTVSSNRTLNLGQVKRSDAASYLCTAKNPASGNIQSGSVVKVIVKSKPTQPTEQNLTSLGNIATFDWKKGYNGGHEQTFVLQTSLNLDVSWTNKTIFIESETQYIKENERFQVNLTSLVPGIYSARLIAFNIIGAAAPVDFKEQFEIKELNEEKQKPSNLALIGGAAGGGIGAILLAVVAVVAVVVFLKKRKAQKDINELSDNKEMTNVEISAGDKSQTKRVNKDGLVNADLLQGMIDIHDIEGVKEYSEVVIT
ncbi:neural cell adhesion molecule 1-like isoform X2 [Mya arenaria]|uniref:neural cell adhesion molecule 1-like isoform X2 n=1 Tax=Mya arenaria TaxID=6604 RepID=UPI0022E74546|nr:neural cell adhesion molecule 1-like isoform X2 [Mya arenaria]